MMLRGRDDNGILKSGFLWKQTKGSIKKWKLYFFVLSRPCLLCFKSEDHMKEGKEPKQKVELCDISLVEVAKKKKGKSKRFLICFETVQDHGVIHLKGHDFSDSSTWSSVISVASEYCKKRKDVHSELKTASFKMNVEHNIRQRMLSSNPNIVSKQVPEVTYLRRVASCEFLRKSQDILIKSGSQMHNKRSVSMDDNLSQRSGSWKFSSPRPLVGYKQSQALSRSNTSVSTTNYSREFLDSTRRDYNNRGNNNNFHNIKVTSGSGKGGPVSRHNSLLSVVPEDRITGSHGEWTSGFNGAKLPSANEKNNWIGRHNQRNISSIQNEYSRSSFSGRARDDMNRHDVTNENLQKYSRLDYSYSGRVAQRSGFDNQLQRGLPKYQSFHGDTHRNYAKFERNSPAYSSLQVVPVGYAKDNRPEQQYQQQRTDTRRSSYQNNFPTSPYPLPPSTRTGTPPRWAVGAGVPQNTQETHVVLMYWVGITLRKGWEFRRPEVLVYGRLGIPNTESRRGEVSSLRP